MTVPREQKATQQKERQQLIQDIKQQNPSITDKQLSRYNIDDLRKIKMATAPKAETEKLSQVEQFDRDVRTGKFSQQYDTFRQPRMQQGGKMKKKHKYQYGGKTISDRDVGGKTTSDRDADIRLAWRLARAEASSGGKSVSDKDFENALSRLSGRTQSDRDRKKQMILERISKLETVGASPHIGEYQYGGMADMSAAPMVKQQKQRKRRAASGFRTKYSKGGGVRASKYKL
mgnify:CR=1 FL=1